jgi:hypothetical protein
MKTEDAMTYVVSRRPVISVIVFDPRLGNVGFMADEVAQGKVFLRVLRFSPAVNSVYVFQ